MLLHCAIAGTTHSWHSTTHKHTSSPSVSISCSNSVIHQCGTTYIFEEKAVAASLEWHGVTQNTLFLLHDWSNTLYCFVIVCVYLCPISFFFLMIKINK